MSYTKGRWYADADGIVRVDTGVLYDTPLKIGSGYIEGAFSYDEATAESRANAKLVSAAPDMLEALEAVIETIESNTEEWWIDVPDRGGFDAQMIKAAISKAKGE